ncbi:hypothetical protein [Alteribacillus bidgolensis]|uniref:Uncharacterized protein n=1 Tax=Alteribacillus bidgolensis TaxID=930129 RepID=A0A1G8JFX1_9BACI|nr:hypothetical protein [Alteribacillus bidgolensis]SDI29550.1 hypothetical protein SAMN05216352_106165 [Alteribacillus bidgolensis]
MSDANVKKGLESLPAVEREVYCFMEKEYELLEQAGEKYDEAKNDTYVEKKASKAFDISEEEAGIIYARAESQLRRHHLYQASE